MQLFVTEFLARYRVVEPFRLPFHCGSLLRGVLGRALRQVGCARGPAPCVEACAQPNTCAYSRFFDPPIPHPLPHKLLRGATHAPQPLLPLIPGPGATELDAGQTLDFGIRILGELGSGDEQILRDALTYLAHFDLGRDSGRVTLDHIERPSPRNRLIELGTTESTHHHASITFETPAWIEQHGTLPTPLEPKTLIRTIYRRLTTLCALYGKLDTNDEDRFPRLDALASQLRVTRASLEALHWSRHSLERNQRHPMKGLLGRLQLEGELGELAGVLRMGQYTHVGKATSHGLGRFGVALS